MKKISLFLFFAAILLGCKKDSSSSNRTNSNVNIKYEFISTVNLTNSNVNYSNESGSISEENKISIGATNWSKEIVYTNTYRPYQIFFNAGLTSNSPGKATGNIYINGTKKASVTVDYQNNGGGLYQALVSTIYMLE